LNLHCILEVTAAPSSTEELKITQCEIGRLRWVGKHRNTTLGASLLHKQQLMFLQEDPHFRTINWMSTSLYLLLLFFLLFFHIPHSEINSCTMPASQKNTSKINFLFGLLCQNFMAIGGDGSFHVEDCHLL
jgi:hypothetical protein